MKWISNSIKELFVYNENKKIEENKKEALKLEVKDNVEQLIIKLNKIANCRSNLTQFKTLIKHSNKGNTYVSLVNQIANKVFDNNRPDLIDLERIGTSATFGNILKGFGRFGFGTSKPVKQHPADNTIIIIFVVGGISFNEIKEIRESIVNHKSNIQVLIGSTKIIKSNDVYNKITNM